FLLVELLQQLVGLLFLRSRDLLEADASLRRIAESVKNKPYRRRFELRMRRRELIEPHRLFKAEGFGTEVGDDSLYGGLAAQVGLLHVVVEHYLAVTVLLDLLFDRAIEVRDQIGVI